LIFSIGRGTLQAEFLDGPLRVPPIRLFDHVAPWEGAFRASSLVLSTAAG
jgi:hypothetical protein